MNNHKLKNSNHLEIFFEIPILNNSWVKKVNKINIIDSLDIKSNENIAHKIYGILLKLYSGKFVALNVFIHLKRMKINKLSIQG